MSVGINFRKQYGMTLAELMVGMAVGLIVTTGVLTVYLTTIRSSSDTLKSSHLNQELAAMMSIMVNDIRRAGYWGVEGECFDYDDYVRRPHTDATLLPGCDPSAGPTYYNPFNTPGSTNLVVHTSMADATSTAQGSGSCILYTYDVDETGSIDSNEYMGFRLNGNELQMRIGGTVVQDCTNGTWRSVNDSTVIQITAVNFDLANSQCINADEPDEADSPYDADTAVDNADEYDCYVAEPTAGSGVRTTEMREVVITLSGQLVSNDPAEAPVDATMVQTVRVRNDLLRIR